MQFLKQIYWKLLWNLRTRWYVDIESGTKHTVLLAGMQRSGTSWCARILNYGRIYRYIWEPFWGERVPLCRELPLYKYMRPHEVYEKESEIIDRVLRGRVRAQFTDAYNTKILSTQRLIKETRANLMLRWIVDRYPDIRMILIVRHPFAVAASMLKLGWVIEPFVYRNQQELVEDYLSRFRDLTESLQTEYEKLIFHWCVQHHIIFDQFKEHKGLCVVHYEDLYNNPHVIIPNIYAHINRKVDVGIYETLQINAHPNDRLVHRYHRNAIDQWKTVFDKSMINKGTEIMKRFGLEHIYDDDGNPQNRITETSNQ